MSSFSKVERWISEAWCMVEDYQWVAVQWLMSDSDLNLWSMDESCYMSAWPLWILHNHAVSSGNSQQIVTKQCPPCSPSGLTESHFDFHEKDLLHLYTWAYSYWLFIYHEEQHCPPIQTTVLIDLSVLDPECFTNNWTSKVTLKFFFSHLRACVTRVSQRTVCVLKGFVTNY